MGKTYIQKASYYINGRFALPSLPTDFRTLFYRSACFRRAQTMTSSQSSEQETAAPVYSVPNETDVFAALDQLVSRIDSESRMEELVNKSQDLNVEDSQLLIDCLSMALDKNVVQAKNRVHVWHSLIKVVSSTKLFAQHHVLNPRNIVTESDNPGVYKIQDEPPTRVKVLVRANDAHVLYSKAFTSWAHLSHPNILPLYAIVFSGEDLPSLVFPCTASANLCQYIQEHPDVLRMPLISDVVSGLYYIHLLDMVHGRLHPKNVLISHDGRAVITELSTLSVASTPLPIRYTAPELLEDDDAQRTKAADMWSFACLCYEVLSGNAPFCQLSSDVKVGIAIGKGNKPNRPKDSGIDEDDTIWQLMLMYISGNGHPGRPSCCKTNDQPELLTGLAVDLELVRTNLTQVLGSDHPFSLRVPENLRDLVLRIAPNPTKLKAAVAAANKLSPDDTQHLVDFLDLHLDDYSNFDNELVLALLCSIMMSTHMVPQCYKLNGVQYDPVPITEDSFSKAYKGRGLSIRINVINDPSVIGRFLKLLPVWSREAHPNTLHFHGVFHEGPNESPRYCFATPLWIGNLRTYAPNLPQKSRLPLISDVINGLSHLHERNTVYSNIILRGESVMILDNGRAVLINSAMASIFIAQGPAVLTRKLRFTCPEAYAFSREGDIWSFGCLCYEVFITPTEPTVSRGELPRRPDGTEGGTEEIDDQAWNLITECCSLSSFSRPWAYQIQELIADWEIEDDRPRAKQTFDNDISLMRSPRPNTDFHRVEKLLNQIQAELLRNPLSKLVQNRIKDVAAVVVELPLDDIRTLVDFLDLTTSISEEQNRTLALLSKITSSTHIFPQRYEVKGIKYSPTPIAEGGYGKVHRGIDLNVCVKVTAKVDLQIMTPWIRELILWAHSSHPNILPFYGVLLEGSNDMNQRICLVSPFMKNGNLHDYAPYLPQKFRFPLLSDVANGLHYLHGLGIIHGDLKGENVLISDQGRGLITDFGTTQITTATTATTDSTVPTTLRFVAPEVVLSSGQPTKERDIWAFGCLCYEVLSRKLPYYQYAQNVQISAALARKEPPKRPGAADHNDKGESDDFDWDDDEEDWDAIDDQAWSLITKCCTPEPEDRLTIPGIQELIKDMKIWDDRPTAKAVPGTEIFGVQSAPAIDLNRVGQLLDQIQEMVAPAERDIEVHFVEFYNSL
ncbi:hypothetical protein D9756_005497 [Leucocoprinus leucothites]|uniref:Protein kinase domain-containing protein n=1 Tax=Leucocoprinus leucothites TaxID=201217 RepID=A0A8H5D6R8_9AGAR|nr:hypothetical protein D9756_005497 [Leucoagaricus leucothites]